VWWRLHDATHAHWQRHHVQALPVLEITKWVHPSSIRKFHMPNLSPMLDRLCVRRLYECYVDRLVQHLLLSLDWVVVARLVEDAAGGR
jgi:hypothetical protein